MKNKLPKGLKRFIRLEKARIRRDNSDSKERERLVKEFCKKVVKD